MNYLLIGTEAYNLNKRKEALIKSILGDNSSMALSFYRGVDKVETREIIDDCQTSPFLSEQKVVLWQDPLFFADSRAESNDEINRLMAYLKQPNESTTLIISYEGQLPANSRLLKDLSGYMKLERYDYPTAEEFANLVNSDLNMHNLKLDRQAINTLLDRLPVNVENWKNELEKLKLYPGRLDAGRIADLISRPLEDDVFELSNAVVDGKLAKAIQVYRDLMVTHKNDVSSLIGLLANQFRTMSQVRIMDDLHYSDEEIAQAISARSSYRIKMVRRAIGNSTSEQLMKLLSELSDLDQQIKSGYIDAQSGLEMFIIRSTKR